jgi:hypothetical protein
MIPALIAFHAEAPACPRRMTESWTINDKSTAQEADGNFAA